MKEYLEQETDCILSHIERIAHAIYLNPRLLIVDFDLLLELISLRSELASFDRVNNLLSSFEAINEKKS